MNRHVSRRTLLQTAILAALAGPLHSAQAQGAQPTFTLPIGLPDRVLGDGFFVRHGYACENTLYNPGWL
jgi:hypothetical protein